MKYVQIMLGNRLVALASAMTDQIQRGLISAIPVGNSQISVLISLNSFPGASIENLSKALGLSHSNMVRAVEQLRQMGFLDKKPGKDSRSTVLFVTSAGAEMVADFYRQREEQFQAVLSPLSPSEQQALAVLVDKLLIHFPEGRENDGRICRYCDFELCTRANCPMHTDNKSTTLNQHNL